MHGWALTQAVGTSAGGTSEAEGGLTVYAVPQTPVVLFSVNGRTVSASLKDPSS